MTYCKNDCCKECSRYEECGGCEKSSGHPFGGSCIAERNKDFFELKQKLIEEINALNISGLFVNDLFLLNGAYVNLEYPLFNQTSVRFLNDKDVYLGNQIEREDSERCYGVVATEAFILVCEYGCNGIDPEILLYKRRQVSNEMNDYVYIDLMERPSIKDQAAEWFSEKWKVPKEAYLKCMESYLNKETNYGWFLCLDKDRIIAGMGVIENDYHNRPDLTPNVCAVYTEEEYRNQGIAGKLLAMTVEASRKKGISPLYLLTEHTDFYERYGWEFLCMVQGNDEPELSRMYIHY